MEELCLYTFSYYREKEGSEIGPQLEVKQNTSASDFDAIKTAKNIANQYNWRLIQVKVSTETIEKIIFE